MSTIEITSEHALPVPTPVRIAVGGKDAPAGTAFQLRDTAAGATFRAQADGPDTVVAVVSGIAAGGRKRFELEPLPRAAPGVGVRAGAGKQLEITVGGKPFTTYHYDETLPRPFFYPVLGPGGRMVTRSFPMKTDVAGETKDHPHHRSWWTAYGEVDESDLWSDGARHGWIRHRDFKQQTSGSVFGGFTEENSWTTREGAPLLAETRTVRFYDVGSDRQLVDYDVLLRATDKDVHFGDTKEGGIVAFRVATTMDGSKGGKIENSNGEVGEKLAWGRRAAWCDYSGTVDGAVVGIAIMDHPSSFRHPCYWHVRDYGLFATNVFGGTAFRPGAPTGAYTLKKGEQISCRYRVLIHPGDAQVARVSDAYHGYIQPPTGKVVG